MVKSLSPWIFRQETPRRLPTDAVVGSLRAEVEFLCPEDGGLGNGGVKINELYIRLGGGFKYFWHFHPYLGKIQILTNIFSNGLKPPTSRCLERNLYPP